VAGFAKSPLATLTRASFIISLYPADSFHLARLCRSGAPTGPADRRTNVTDLIVLVLSTGGILLMAAYAVLCDKI
jgi:hypothetical protein